MIFKITKNFIKKYFKYFLDLIFPYSHTYHRKVPIHLSQDPRAYQMMNPYVF